jgi:hypothetical protein
MKAADDVDQARRKPGVVKPAERTLAHDHGRGGRRIGLNAGGGCD